MNTGPVLKKNDFYPTPLPVVKSFLSAINLKPTDTFREPCMGNGVIYDNVSLPDNQKDWCEIQHDTPRDYLNQSLPLVDVVITNPPFSLFEAFLLKSIAELKPGGTICYLLRNNTMGSKKRKVFWSVISAPTHQITIVPRPSFTGGGSDSAEYAWFCWDFGNRIPADKIDWIHWKD